MENEIIDFPLSNYKEEIERICSELSFWFLSLSNYENFEVSIHFYGVPVQKHLNILLPQMQAINYYPTNYYVYRTVNESMRGRKYIWTDEETYLSNALDMMEIKFIFRLEFFQ
jgi:hypothetical protein